MAGTEGRSKPLHFVGNHERVSQVQTYLKVAGDPQCLWGTAKVCFYDKRAFWAATAFCNWAQCWLALCPISRSRQVSRPCPVSAQPWRVLIFIFFNCILKNHGHSLLEFSSRFYGKEEKQYTFRRVQFLGYGVICKQQTSWDHISIIWWWQYHHGRSSWASWR